MSVSSSEKGRGGIRPDGESHVARTMSYYNFSLKGMVYVDATRISEDCVVFTRHVD